MLHELTTTQQFDELLANKQSFIIYKYKSRRCRPSRLTKPYITQHAKQYPVYLANIRYKDLKEYIAASTDIKHETPQVIVFKEGAPTAHTSHMHITPERLAEHAEV